MTGFGTVENMLAGEDGEAAVESLNRLRARLSAEAAAEGLLDVAYCTIDTPIGSLLLAATPDGLVRIALPNEDQERVLAELAVRISPRILNAPSRFDQAAREIGEYLSRSRRSFDLAIDLRLASGFRRSVLRQLLEIEYGATASYAQVAAASGNPRAVRAVGSACATNPLPLVVPCHRVLRSDGTLGGYAGGLQLKRRLLELEGQSEAGQ